MTATPGYDAALAEAAEIYPGIRVGRPGRSRGWPVIGPLLNLLRVKFVLDMDGAQHVAPGAAIIVSNHLSAWDPVVTVIPPRWRVSAFTKVEMYEGRAAPFFRWLGQIPLRRGDERSTDWALDMARRALADGGKVGIYPEGTRGPDREALYRLHQRVLVPLLVGSPDAAVHAVAVRYTPKGRRTVARIRVSERLPIDARTMSGAEMTEVIRASLVELGGFRYVDQYAVVAKARLERERLEREGQDTAGAGPTA
jgi:1-acyl-sn-glycerol-3-phosphate acyltransferase